MDNLYEQFIDNLLKKVISNDITFTNRHE